MALKQVYVYEKIPPEFILLFREQKDDPYWCQRCPYAFFPTRPDAMRHGKQHCMKDERVVTCTGQKPITEEARKEKERRRKRAWMQVGHDDGGCGWKRGSRDALTCHSYRDLDGCRLRATQAQE